MLLLFLLAKPGFDKNITEYTAGDQYVFYYQSELIAYTDFQKLYSNDTTARRKMFFGSAHLQEFQMQLTATVMQTVLQVKENGWVSVFG